MVYEFKKAEMDYVGDVYAVDVDGITYLLVYSSLAEVKDNQLHWVVYLTDKTGNVLCESFAPFDFTRHNQIGELLNILADNARNRIRYLRFFRDIPSNIYGHPGTKAFFG